MGVDSGRGCRPGVGGRPGGRLGAEARKEFGVRWVVWGAERPHQGGEGQGRGDWRDAMTQRWPRGAGRGGPGATAHPGKGARGAPSVRQVPPREAASETGGEGSFWGVKFGFGGAGEGQEAVASPAHSLSSHRCRD